MWMILVIKRVKTTVPWTYVTEGLNSEEIVGMFYEKELQKTNQTVYNWRSNKQKSDNLYFKWKGYDNLLNSWKYKKDIV